MKVLLVDDESLARDRMRRLLSAFPDVEIVGEAGDGLSALESVERLSPDALFLDIEMPELDGLGVASALRDRGVAIVFVTAYDEHALKAFEVAAIDYLVKPVNPDRLSVAVERLRSRQVKGDVGRLLAAHPSAPSRKFAVKSGSKFVVVDPSAIVAVVARDHYAAIMVGEKEYLSEESLDVLLERIGLASLIRIHRSALINLDHLKELKREGDRKYLAVMTTGLELPIARERLDAVRSKL